MSGTQPQPLPVACSLTADELGDRRAVWQRLADTALQGEEATASGVRLTYRSAEGVEDKLRQLAVLEAECCGFAEWKVHRRGEAVVLMVTTAPESVGAVHELFGMEGGA